MQLIALYYSLLPMLALGAILKSHTRPTPAPTGPAMDSTTIHIKDRDDFAILAPATPSQSIADAENDAIAFCSSNSSGQCDNTIPDGFITAAAVKYADDGSYVQITGCIDPSKFHMSLADDGGQYDVRYPNGAQCTFGGYGASFIEQIEPSANRFCVRCCAQSADQVNCNSHQDRAGCAVAIPGTYDFPELGVSCT
ncbi:hypothetical protein CPB85DRAFT_1343999 [Mucidula mucida]|nr:hypothetical protein CPB85DRAFT_1343999 [Mucidula mucida]